jgi:hypothetical protein
MEPHLRLRRITQTIADLAGKPWQDMRILDLGSLEGLFAIECAVHGAKVLGIEGREGNNLIARRTAQSMCLSNVEFVTDDVRNFSRQRFGDFDVVICSGILYHLPGEDGCRFIHSIAEACTRLTIIDTHVGVTASTSVSFDGRRYFGSTYKEHDAGDSAKEKLARAWASLDNPISFWITKPSLLNLLRDAGFSSVHEILRPRSFADYSDRLSFAAIKSELQKSTMSPELQATKEPDWPEVSDLIPFGYVEPDRRPSLRQIASAIKHRIKS